ncbi:MAG TPA: SRPBCC family protein [Acidimicrobiia bacterium]|nr:SRPBCC family protein [Acidimicrobiia bacterium]
MPRYEYEASAATAAPAETVWDILVDSLRWPEWTGLPRPTMDREGDPPPFGLGAIRAFHLGPVTVREEVELWEPPHRYGYTVSGLGLRNYHAVVTIETGTGATVVTWRGGFDGSSLPGASRPVLWGIRTGIGRITRRLARHAETVARPAGS